MTMRESQHTHSRAPARSIHELGYTYAHTNVSALKYMAMGFLLHLYQSSFYEVYTYTY